MPPRTSSRTPAAKPAAKAAATKAAPKAKASKPAAKATKAEPKPAKTTKAAAMATTKAPVKAAAKPTKAPAPKAPAAPKAGTKRGRTSDAAEAPAPKKVAVKRRRTGPLVNPLPGIPTPEGLAVFVWGTGDMGQFGLGPDELDEKPRPQLHGWFQEQMEEGKSGAAPGKGGVETIAAGGMHSLAVDEAGQLHSWGINDNAALGRNTAKNPDPENKGGFLPADEFETWPLVVESLKKEDFRPVKIAASDSVSVAIDDEGGLRAWGSFRSNEGILGFTGKKEKELEFEPTELAALAGVEVVDIACGADHVLALTSDGYIYAWGNGQQYQLGRRVLERRMMQGLDPQRLGLRNIVKIGAGQYHSFAVDKDGKVYAWGLNTFKQLGLSGREADEEMVSHPVHVTALDPSAHGGAKVVQVTGGEHHSIFLFDNGAVFGAGRCDADELGLSPDHPEQATLSERRATIQAEKQQAVTDSTAALEEAKKGGDEAAIQAAELLVAEAEGAARVPGDEYVDHPVRITFPPIPEEYTVVPEHGAYSDAIVNPIAQVSAGTRHNLAVSKSGHLYAWGLGQQGQLGLGSEESAGVPTLVRSKQLRPFDSVSASAGGQHCVLLAKKRDE